ncbi:hypothetical protein D3C73_1296290 [compost metagenome]
MLIQIPAQIRSPSHILPFGRSGGIRGHTVPDAVYRAAAAKSNLCLLHGFRELLRDIRTVFIQQPIPGPVQQQLAFDRIRIMVLVVPEDNDIAKIAGSHHGGDFGVPAG